ncbi:12870_t:CDS:2, partial [Funneliformis caledonium]
QNTVTQLLNEIQNLSSPPITQSPQFFESNVFSNKSNLVSANSIIEQYKFYRVYKGEEIIIPYGNRKVFPLYINFANLSNRITNLKSELLKIIKGQKYSEYRVNVIKKIQEIELSKVNNLLIQINYFESLQPGYYGLKGLAIILKILTELFIQIEILTVDLCIPQSSSQYLFQVLVPETAIRLIAEDYKGISLNDTKEIMIDSVDFGLYIHDDNCKN